MRCSLRHVPCAASDQRMTHSSVLARLDSLHLVQPGGGTPTSTAGPPPQPHPPTHAHAPLRPMHCRLVRRCLAASSPSAVTATLPAAAAALAPPRTLAARHHSRHQQQHSTPRHSTPRQLHRSASTTATTAVAPMAASSSSAEQLRGQSCSLLGCSSDTPRLTPEQVAELLPLVPAWRLAPDGLAIRRSFVAKNFVAAIDFFNAVKTCAEAEGHHPDLHLTNFRDVEVVLSTHAIKGLSMLDMVLAAKIDALPVQYSPKWAREEKARLAAEAAAAAAARPAAAAAE